MPKHILISSSKVNMFYHISQIKCKTQHSKMIYRNDIPSYLASLCKDIFACTDKVSGIKAGLKLCGNKNTLGSKLMAVFNCTNRIILAKKMNGKHRKISSVASTDCTC